SVVDDYATYRKQDKIPYLEGDDPTEATDAAKMAMQRRRWASSCARSGQTCARHYGGPMPPRIISISIRAPLAGSSSVNR
ncbi:hypothetical protein, partial [Rhizobium leguminosarum]|uniref:hypothetical protein n=1 Tax=Rhizobium leguminosarum TaxID=384 RepID=UPI003F9D7262